jgi:hypothetical protein
MAVVWRKLAYSDDVITKALLTEQGDIIYASAASTPAALAHGTTGQVLITQGNGANPAWSSAPVLSQVITDNSPVTVDQADAADNDFAKFTANGLEGRSYTELKSDIGLDAAAVAAVAAAGVTLADAKAIEYTTPSASHTASGVFKTKTAGASLVFGDACYMGTDGKMEKALADDAAITIPATHLCIATIAENAAGLFLEQGEAHDDSWAFDVGLSVYLSAATAGLITKTMPVKVTGNQVQVLGTCTVADTIQWNPSMIVLEYL